MGISPDSSDAVFSLMWPNQFGLLRLTVIPPGGAPPIVKESTSGLINLAESLPLVAPFDPRGDWKVKVEVPTVAGVAAVRAANGDVIPFTLHLMTDDPAIKSELSVVPGDYKAGANIRLRAKLTHFGIPIVGLGTNPARKVKVDLEKHLQFRLIRQRLLEEQDRLGRQPTLPAVLLAQATCCNLYLEILEP